MTRAELIQQIREKKSFLCVGLDPDLTRFPTHLLDKPNAVLEFNKAIIDATKDFCVAYKPNAAFFEALPNGWQILKETVAYIPDTHLKLIDAKRGDIGNTCHKYAKAAFEELGGDALTIAPYMGYDSVQPFLEHKGKWVVALGLTSNKGSQDFQMQKLESGEYLYERVIKQLTTWGNPDELMLVIGATHPKLFKEIRKIAPDHFFLVPGVGAQGGTVKNASGLNSDIGLLINSTRGIIYAGNGLDYAEKSGEAAMKLQSEMAAYL